MTTTELDLEQTRELVRRSRAGDSAAFAELVEAHQVTVFGTALRLLREREAAADVANRAFFKAYQSLASYDDSRPLRPWLARIATNEALNELRGSARDAAHLLDGEAGAQALEQAPGGADPAEAVLEREPSAAIRAAVGRLPEVMRLVVVLRYFDDLSYAEIAEQAGLTVNAVGVTLSRARERLRRELAREGVQADAMS